MPAQPHAEAKDQYTFGQWLQAMSYACSPSHPMCQRSANFIQSEFVDKGFSKRNENFHHEWQQGQAFAATVMKSQGVPDDIITKASAQSETVGSLGGFTVPVQFWPELIRLAGEKAKILPKVRKYTMVGLQMNVPAIDYSKGGSGASPYLGGMVAGWLQDGQTFPQTNASLREIILKANILSGYTVANRTLLADNQVGLQEVLTQLMADTIAYYVDYAIINGTGVNQPQGIAGSASTISISRTGTSSGNLLTDVARMYGALHPDGMGDAEWLVSPSSHAKFITMNDASGRVVYQPTFPQQSGGPITVRAPYMILGLPVQVSQLAATAASTGDVQINDYTQYAFGMRQELELGVSEHVNFLSNQLTYRFLFRGDGQSRLNTYITLANGDTVSPFVSYHS